MRVTLLCLQVVHDIEDYSNALNRLQEQLDKISDAANEEQVCVVLILSCEMFLMWLIMKII